MNYSQYFETEMKKLLVGTPLEKSEVQFLSYVEDEELTIAFDIIGGECDVATQDKILEYLKGLGLTIDGFGEQLGIPPTDGFRVYTTSKFRSLAEFCKDGRIAINSDL
ncbi:hypothetical protein [Fibrobacter succinogenes]|jgi:hypothetical protein|uniref:hypothetical protein n=1 Tax=Fibrobacter succinogenes TaxID=833 RepID=UPI0015685383|nr:hypothetical protein [Fibrobacter succinogenes]